MNCPERAQVLLDAAWEPWFAQARQLSESLNRPWWMFWKVW
jgi:hypothetical protein